MKEINREVLVIALLGRRLNYIILKDVMCLSWDMSDGKELICQMAENSCSERDQVKLFPGVPCPRSLPLINRGHLLISAGSQRGHLSGQLSLIHRDFWVSSQAGPASWLQTTFGYIPGWWVPFELSPLLDCAGFPFRDSAVHSHCLGIQPHSCNYWIQGCS